MGKLLINVLLILISIQIIECVIIFRRFNIEITNKLGGNKRLMVQCRSGDNETTQLWFFHFNDRVRIHLTIFPKTLIWCNLWKGPDYVHHVRFNAFVASESFIHDVCGSMKPNVCFWKVQDDGIWARHNPTGALKLMYEWDTLNFDR
ncbi:unnamed protein product [Cochlearia groenlandica]